MKKCIIILSLFLISNVSLGQTTEEWLQQKQTQRKYLIQQIASLKMYIGYAQKGYSIAQKGLETIDNIKNGEWHLHSDFFNSLNQVNPKIKNYTRVADIIALQVKILHTYKSTYQLVQQNNLFNSGEVDYAYQILTALVRACATDIDDLTRITTAGGWQMKDDERLRRVDALYNTILDKYSFAQSFGKEVKLMAIQRMKETNAIQTSRSLNGLKNE